MKECALHARESALRARESALRARERVLRSTYGAGYDGKLLGPLVISGRAILGESEGVICHNLATPKAGSKSTA